MSTLNQIRIEKIFITETGTHEDMVARPFTTHVTGTNDKMVKELTMGGREIDGSSLAGLAGQIIMPSANAERVLDIPNGWATKRYRFTIICSYGAGHIASNVYYLYTGYTSETGYAPGINDFDPHMRLFINNCIVIQNTQTHRNGQIVPVTQVTENNQILHFGSLGGGLDTRFDIHALNQIQIPSTMRPMDLMRSIANDLRSGDYPELDIRTGISTTKTNRANNLPSTYLSRGLESVIVGTHNPTDSTMVDPSVLFERAAKIQSESSAITDPFLMRLDRDQGYTINGFVTWGGIKANFPELANGNVVDMFVQGQAQRKDLYQVNRGDYQAWTGYDHATGSKTFDTSVEALISTMLLTSLPTVLIQHLMARCQIHITNMVMGLNNGYKVTITNPFGIIPKVSGATIMGLIPYAEKMIEILIVRDLPVQYGIALDIHITMDVFGDSVINVSYNGNPHVPYGAASFADAMYCPIITATQHHLKAVANDIRWLADSII